MSDESVRLALRSECHIVTVEAPAGCGKTTQGAEYAREIAHTGYANKVLILTHTNAACSVFSERTKGVETCVEIRTFDSVIAQIASTYHQGLGLPTDISSWVRQRSNGHADLAVKVAGLLKRYPMIATAIAARFPIVICDEHQDSSRDQNYIAMALHERGAKLRLFSDPMQRVFSDRAVTGSLPQCDWDALVAQAQAFEQLDTPHRWSTGNQELGRWTLAARAALKSGGRVDLRAGLASGVIVVRADNQAQTP